MSDDASSSSETVKTSGKADGLSLNLQSISNQALPNVESQVSYTHRPPVQKRTYKIIVLGDSNVGKTCLTHRFCQGKFPNKTDATVGVDFREKVVQVGSELIKLQIWDTAGQERFRKSMVPHYYRNVHGIVFVYDVTRIASFENLAQWMAECDMHNPGRNLPRVLVGNKCDCPANAVSVSTNMAQRFAERHQMELFETSARDETKSDHVESVFVTLVCKLMILRSGFTPTPDESKTRPQLIELRPVITKRQDDCLC